MTTGRGLWAVRLGAAGCYLKGLANESRNAKSWPADVQTFSSGTEGVCERVNGFFWSELSASFSSGATGAHPRPLTRRYLLEQRSSTLKARERRSLPPTAPGCALCRQRTSTQ